MCSNAVAEVVKGEPQSPMDRIERALREEPSEVLEAASIRPAVTGSSRPKPRPTQSPSPGLERRAHRDQRHGAVDPDQDVVVALRGTEQPILIGGA